MKTLILIYALLLSFSSHAQDEATPTSRPVIAWSDSVEPFTHKNTISIEALSFATMGLTGAAYQRMITEHIAIGASYLSGKASKGSTESSGTLSNDTYYEKDFKAGGKMPSIFTNYYLAENGHRKSGFVFSLTYSQLEGETELSSRRYGPDNGFIQIGDGKRLLQEYNSTAPLKMDLIAAGFSYQLSLRAYNSLFDRLNLNIGAKVIKTLSHSSKTLTAPDNTTKNADESSFNTTAITLGLGIPF